MQRWNVETSKGTMKLYYNTYEEALNLNPNAINITENNESEYLEYVNKIKNMSEKIFIDYRGRNIYKIPYSYGFMLVRLYCDRCGQFYYDGLEYQIYDRSRLIEPIGFTVSDPKTFYNMFFDNNQPLLPIETISKNELKKMKAKKFWNKNNVIYLKDRDGYFYYGDKRDLPCKSDIDEYEKFKNNNNAVLVCYGELCGVDKYCKWFESIDDFKKVFDEYKKQKPPSHGTPSYVIKKIGYKKAHPNERKIIFRLPYFNLDNEYKLHKNDFNKNGIYHSLARTWCGMMKDYKQFGNWCDNIRWVEDLIKRYFESNLNISQN